MMAEAIIGILIFIVLLIAFFSDSTA